MSGRNQDGAKLFAKVEGENYMGRNLPCIQYIYTCTRKFWLTKHLELHYYMHIGTRSRLTRVINNCILFDSQIFITQRGI